MYPRFPTLPQSCCHFLITEGTEVFFLICGVLQDFLLASPNHVTKPNYHGGYLELMYIYLRNCYLPDFSEKDSSEKVFSVQVLPVL